MKRKRRKEVELYVPKGYTFEELYDGDDTGLRLRGRIARITGGGKIVMNETTERSRV